VGGKSTGDDFIAHPIAIWGCDRLGYPGASPMRVFSPSEAVMPAIERTRRFLFQSFDLVTYLKLTAVACISEGFSANFNFSSHIHPSTGDVVPSLLSLSDEFLVLLVIAIVAAILAGLFFFYLVNRLRFAFFHCLLQQTTEIRPGWSLHRAQAERLFEAGLIIWAIFLVLATIVVVPFILEFWRVFQSVKSGAHFDLRGFILLVLPFIGIVALLCLIAGTVDVVVHDFILPHMALDDATFREAWRAARAHIGREKGSFFFYLLMRLVLPVIAMLILLISAGIPLIGAFGILMLCAAGFRSLFDGSTLLSSVFGVFFEILFGFVGLIVGLSVAFGLGGPVATWVRNYALLFYGGRYQALGDILSPPPSLPPTPSVDAGVPKIA
jgi:hypothetical protein